MSRFLLLIIILFSFNLILGCSKNAENKITISKLKNNKEHQFIAYKEDIPRTTANKVDLILTNANGKSYSFTEESPPPPNYMIYFNDRKKENKLTVHSIWLKKGNETILKKDNTYIELNENDSKYINEIINNIKK
ncbi:hypothetical protein [Bacillus massiliigorillae]|uniref:hypothetical protein n=1 Tax=Bacillus massiliigorillae TaxID=1243664 RepID=UPI00039D195F|nr:hypothetical protein [Bacillus massiliigorillae]